MFTAYDLVLSHVSAGTDLEEACRFEGVNFDRFVTELDNNVRFRRSWERAEALWLLIEGVRRDDAR